MGIPYSHDMCPCDVCFPGGERCKSGCNRKYVGCPLIDGDKVAEQPADFTTLTDKYTRRAIDFLTRSAGGGDPFFLYLPYHHTHHPQFAGRAFRNTTARGGFGDALAEMDDSVGKVLSALRGLGLMEDTLVLFTSDNGPSLTRQERGGCAGLLRCGKGTTWEGGMRVPAVVHWEGKIRPGYSDKLGASLDVFPTFLALANVTSASVPVTHGRDFSELFLGASDKVVLGYCPTYR